MQTPTATPTPNIEFNPDALDFTADPYPTYTRLREEAPVYYWSEARAWIVSRFDDVASVLRDPRLAADPAHVGLPSREQALPPEIRAPFEQGLFALAPKDHHRVRKAVSPAFTPRAVERLRPMIQGIVDDALAPWAGKPEIDIAAFADYVPLRVISAMLGIPAQHEPVFRAFGEALINIIDPRATPEQLAERLAPVPAGIDLIHALIAERRHNLGDDLLSTLIRAEEQGERLSSDEMLGLVAGLITAGSETTVHFICFAAKSLLCVPERAAAVREDPSILRQALEEVLRQDSFGKSGLVRWAREDIEISGVTIKRQEMILALLPAALRDPRAYPDPDTFDPRRQPEEILSFGIGPHFCLGAALARLEGEIAIATLLRRYATMRIAAEPEYAPHPIIRKMATLRVAVTPATSDA